ncbi:MAG: hypothetical protein M5U28_55895 [Sandaracinaceae bacterium]|nr:hypothetical protein [Sandaracinaceae bacterium]
MGSGSGALEPPPEPGGPKRPCPSWRSMSFTPSPSERRTPPRSSLVISHCGIGRSSSSAAPVPGTTSSSEPASVRRASAQASARSVTS